jgi:WD40 repeat protein
MGVVYKARDERLKRLVALKMVLAGEHAGARERHRFRVEAEAVGRLQHPNIVPVYEVGEQQDRPYFAMEYLEGGTLAARIKDAPLPAREAAGLVETLARAMQAAHLKGIVHRDLKPGNILLTGGPDLPLPQCTPKVADFGLAKLLDTEGQTGTHTIMGTPSYMAPEQAVATKTIGPAADIYSLGAVLYDLVTGRPPFKAATWIDTLQQVISEEPAAPTRLNPNVPRDLETICLKCLRKEPMRRYGSAEALAEDLHRYLAGEPILARRTSGFEQMLMWARRRPAVAALVVVVVLAAVALLALGIALWRNAELRGAAVQNLDRASKELEGLRDDIGKKVVEVEVLEGKAKNARTEVADAEKQTRLFKYIGGMRLVQADWEVNRIAKVLDTLSRNVPQPGQDDPRGLEWYHYWHLCHASRPLGEHAQGTRVMCVAVSPDDKVAASGGSDRFVKLWNPADGKETSTFQLSQPINGIAFASDSQALAVAPQLGPVQVHDLNDNKKQPTLLVLPQNVKALCVAFAPNGQTVAVGCTDKKVRLWNVGTDEKPRPLEEHGNPIQCVAFSSDGAMLATASFRDNQGQTIGEVKLWNVATGKELAVLSGHLGVITSVAFSPDDKTLATASWDRTVKLWDVEKRKERTTLQGHVGVVRAVAFSLDSQALASASDDTTVRLWDPATGRERATLKGHTAAVRAVAFAPDSKALISGGEDAAVKWWDLARLPERTPLQAHTSRTWAVAFSPNGRTVGTTNERGTAKLWNAATGEKVADLKGYEGFVNCLAFSPDGKTVVTGGEDKKVWRWDAATGKQQDVLEGHDNTILSVAYSADGKALVTTSLDSTVRVWNAETGKLVWVFEEHGVRCAVFAPDGKTVVVGRKDGWVRIWDVEKQREQHAWQAHAGAVPVDVRVVAISSDGKILATGSDDGTAKVWDLGKRKQLQELKGHRRMGRSVALTADGRTLVTAAGEVKLWDVGTGEERATFAVPGKQAYCAAVAHDQGRMAAGSEDGSVLLWDAPRDGARAEPLRKE